MKATSQAYLWAQTDLLERSEQQAKRWIRLRSGAHMRTTNFGACATDVFSESDLSTGKECDTESGNDYFMARYYASSMGRFLSPDWSAKIVPVPYAKLTDPQSLNLYAYMLNNPLAGVDPDGHCGFDIGCYVSLALGVANGIQRDGGVGPYLKNVATGILKGTGSAAVNTLKLAASGGDPGKLAASMIEPGPKALQPSNTTQAQASLAAQVLLPAAAGLAAGPVLGAVGEAEAAAGVGTTSLFRAVGPAEADSIESLGSFSVAPNGTEFKGFFFSQSDAESFGAASPKAFGELCKGAPWIIREEALRTDNVQCEADCRRARIPSSHDPRQRSLDL